MLMITYKLSQTGLVFHCDANRWSAEMAMKKVVSVSTSCLLLDGIFLWSFCLFITSSFFMSKNKHYYKKTRPSFLLSLITCFMNLKWPVRETFFFPCFGETHKVLSFWAGVVLLIFRNCIKVIETYSHCFLHSLYFFFLGFVTFSQKSSRSGSSLNREVTLSLEQRTFFQQYCVCLCCVWGV